MKKLGFFSFCFVSFVFVSACHAIDLKQSKITQVVNDVQIISATGQTQKSAAVNDVFTMPDILRTGAASRAELVAEDETITRVGANTIFSFDPASRTLDLQQGSLLFHSPHGKGGGTIHTGSATASVLGTTLIVTTTPNGGMKVLDLEGHVEVKFLNGLKQKLSPGEMTFILPGGNRFAPIIVFRLDKLTEKSLLVKGFTEPLSSMPLIADQIAKQTKQIQSGRATDTGLLVGDNANENQVAVLDPNTIQTIVNSAGANTALGADATINQSSLADKSVPTPPNHVFTDAPFILPGNDFFAGQSFEGFAAHDILVNTHAASSLTIDLNPYAKNPEFDLVAANDLEFEGSATFTGLSAKNKFSLIGGNGISFAPGVTVQANAGDFEVSTPGALTLSAVTLANDTGMIGLVSGSEINVENGASINTPGHITMTAPVAVNISGANVGVDNTTIITDPNSGQVNLNGSSSVSISSTSIQTHYLTVNSGDGILLDGTGETFAASGANSSASFTAPNSITINNADFSSFAILNLIANTVTVNGANLPRQTFVQTLLGLVNINNSVENGYFNIINSRWMGTPITSSSQITFSSPQGSSPGIYLTTRP
jgi:hypothetical protein